MGGILYCIFFEEEDFGSGTSFNYGKCSEIFISRKLSVSA